MKFFKRVIHAVWHIVYHNMLFRLKYLSEGKTILVHNYWRIGLWPRIYEMYYILLRRKNG